MDNPLYSMFLFSLFVPMAVLYTGFSLYMSLKEGKTSGKKTKGGR